MRDYTKIAAWQYSDDLTVMIYEITQSFPKEELYGLTSQLRRAAYSVPSNIAEGSARNTLKDYLHFLYMARGSLTEVHYFTHLVTRLTYIDNQAKAQLRDDISNFLKITRTYSGCGKGIRHTLVPRFHSPIVI